MRDLILPHVDALPSSKTIIVVRSTSRGQILMDLYIHARLGTHKRLTVILVQLPITLTRASKVITIHAGTLMAKMKGHGK